MAGARAGTKKKVKGSKDRGLSGLLELQRQFFSTGRTRDLAFRKQALGRLRSAVKERYGDIVTALQRDLRKPEFESYITEIAFLFQEIDHAVSHVALWSRKKRVRTPWLLQPASSWIVPEPYGTVLVMGPWNYPFQLVMAPLVAAVAAGNTAVVKPSELAPRTSRVVADIIGSAFSPAHVAAVTGGVEESRALLAERFDYIFFTGGTGVGRVVMEAASKHLTPVTLELGGKSPAIVTEDAAIEGAAKKIVWGKFVNAGQTCIAPDYVLVHRDVKEALVKAMKGCITRFYGEAPLGNPAYPRIIHSRHWERLRALIREGRTIHGGRVDKKTLSIEPTILDGVKEDAPVMREEIFGPILPVCEFSSLDEAVSMVMKNPTPLALYLFTRSRAVQERIVRDIQAGAVVINDVIIHVANYRLPFGGVGQSGMGAYHGRFGFDTFSHRKAVMKRRFTLDILMRYPPYKIPVRFLRGLFG